MQRPWLAIKSWGQAKHTRRGHSIDILDLTCRNEFSWRLRSLIIFIPNGGRPQLKTIETSECHYVVTFTPLQFLLSPYFCTPFGHQKCVTRKLHPYPKPSVGRVECEDGGRVYLSKHTTKGKHVASVMNRIQERLVWHHEYLVEIRSSNSIPLWKKSKPNNHGIETEGHKHSKSALSSPWVFVLSNPFTSFQPSKSFKVRKLPISVMRRRWPVPSAPHTWPATKNTKIVTCMESFWVSLKFCWVWNGMRWHFATALFISVFWLTSVSTGSGGRCFCFFSGCARG